MLMARAYGGFAILFPLMLAVFSPAFRRSLVGVHPQHSFSMIGTLEPGFLMVRGAQVNLLIVMYAALGAALLP